MDIWCEKFCDNEKRLMIYIECDFNEVIFVKLKYEKYLTN